MSAVPNRACALRPRRHAEQRQDRTVQCAHRQPAEGRHYPGVTVERKAGIIQTPAGNRVNLIDLPAPIRCGPQSRRSDHARHRARPVRQRSTARSAAVVADATNLRLALRLVLELKQVGCPLLLVLNMIDIARRRGIEIDLDKLSQELGVPWSPRSRAQRRTRN